jgi:hypothetical protein
LWLPEPHRELAFQAFETKIHGAGLCRSCSAAVEALFDEGQKAFWKELPALFDLPPWEELKSYDG